MLFLLKQFKITLSLKQKAKLSIKRKFQITGISKGSQSILNLDGDEDYQLFINYLISMLGTMFVAPEEKILTKGD